MSSKQQNAVSAALAAGVPAGQQRSVCLSLSSLSSPLLTYPPLLSLSLSHPRVSLLSAPLPSVSCVAEATQRKVMHEFFTLSVTRGTATTDGSSDDSTPER